MSNEKEFEPTVTMSLKQFKELEAQADCNRSFFLGLESITAKYNKFEINKIEYSKQVFNYVTQFLEE